MLGVQKAKYSAKDDKLLQVGEKYFNGKLS